MTCWYGLAVGLVGLAGLCLGAGGCGSRLPSTPEGTGDGGAEAGASLTWEPTPAEDSAPAVLRLRVEPPAGVREEPSAVQLYTGRLSSFHLGRIEANELPSTLMERRVPAVSWLVSDASAVVLAPSIPLTPGEQYSVASPSSGLLGELRVSERPSSPLDRIWPPPDATDGAEYAVYCGPDPVMDSPQQVQLAPGGHEAWLRPGAHADGDGSDGCVRLVSSQPLPDGETWVPPLRFGSHVLDPTPLRSGAAESPAALQCDETEAAFGPGCARVLDDRLVVRSFAQPAFWAIRAPGLSLQRTVEAEERMVLRGLQPSTAIRFDATVVDLSGHARKAAHRVHTAPAQAHLVINEVMADPLGAEPEQEWIELVNDGLVAVNTGGWIIEDVGGETPLPSVVMMPGEHALVARRDFDETSMLDVQPAPDVVWLRVAELGTHGLTNAGEPLTLKDPGGRIHSKFPAAPKPKAGISVARRNPWSLDDAPGAFAHHGAEGASPGWVNELVESE